MEAHWSHTGKTLVAVLSGRMDAVSAQMFEQQAQSQSQATKASRLVLDMAKLEYISSVGLRSLLVIGKKLQETGGVLCMSGIRGLVKDILESSNFVSLFQIFKTLDDALAAKAK